MAPTVTADDIRNAIGVPFASAADEQWADLCADAATAFVAPLPVAADPAAEPQTRQAAVLLAVNLYHRRPSGAVAPDFEGAGMQIGPALDPIVSRMLRIGPFQREVVA